MKKNGLLTLALTFTVLFAFGQTEKKTSIGVNYSVNYNYRYLVDKDGQDVNATLISGRNNIEIPLVSFAAGVRLERRISTRLFLETGVEFSRMGYRFSWSNLRWEDQIDATRGFVLPGTEPISTIAIHWVHDYVGIPIKLNYVTQGERLQFVYGLGLTPNVLLQAKTINITRDMNGKKGRNSHGDGHTYKTFNLMPMASFGLNWNMNDRFSLRSELIGRYGILDIIENKPVTAKLYNVGINLTGYYSLGKK